MPMPSIKPTRDRVLKGVARFKDINRVYKGLPDMALPESRRAFLNVLGFEQPEGEDGHYSPFGDEAKAVVSHLKAGFGISFVEAEPGRGVLTHNHDTVETFMCMTGRWRVLWEGADGNESIELDTFDFIALEPGVQRRFECVEPAAGASVGLLLGMIGGEAPAGEFSPESVKRMKEAGVI